MGEGRITWVPYRVFSQFCAQAFQIIIDSTIGLQKDMKVPEIVFAPSPDDATLSGSVRFLNLFQDEMRVMRVGEVFRFTDTYFAGTKFRIQIAGAREAFVHILNADDKSQGTSSILPDMSLPGGFQLKSGGQLVFPPVGKGYLELDTTASIDHFCILFSTRQLAVDSLIAVINSGPGGFVERVCSALSPVAVASQGIHYAEDGSPSFWAADTTKSVVPLFFDMQHFRE